MKFNTWGETKCFIDDLRGTSEFIWRGHSDTNWLLSSSLYRYFEAQGIPNEFRRKYEKSAIEQFQTHNVQRGITSPRQTCTEMESMVLMQHYGCPTRLIDWTWSPYVAAYFILADMGEKGAIYALNLTEYQALLAPSLPLDDYDNGLLPVLPKRIFERLLSNHDIQNPIPITVPNGSGRPAEQQCIFLLDLILSSTTEGLLDFLPDKLFWKLELPRSTRLDIHADLLSMNIDGKHLFGGTHGAAVRAKEWLFGARDNGHSIKTEDVEC